MNTAELIDDENQMFATVPIPEGESPQLITFAMRFFLRQPSGRYREVWPYLAIHPWPPDWREQHQARAEKHRR